MILYSTDSWETEDPFNLFKSVKVISSSKQLKMPGCLILWGGEDIGTSLYHEKPNSHCTSEQPSKRDLIELDMIAEAISMNMPIIGICRGAQLVCVAAGGSLMQHIDKHLGLHNITLHDEEDTTIVCNSSHHQMMVPNSNAKILASATHTTGVDGNNKQVTVESVPEVVYFPIINALGIQPHPEWSSCPSDFINYCIRKIKEYLL
jgi:gamma-glutamyl-gamma-aminobutyrate hydrolase PuuD